MPWRKRRAHAARGSEAQASALRDWLQRSRRWRRMCCPAPQGGFDPELAACAVRNRRAVLKGGIVLSLDPKVGDFANGDVLIEDGKIREVRPNIEATTSTAAIIDASNRIVIPGFVDTHSHSYQGLLRNSLANGLVDPDYNRDVQNKLDARLHAGRRLYRRTHHGARLHRYGYDRDHRPLADQPYARAQRRLHPRAAAFRHSRGLWLFARRWRAIAVAAGHRPLCRRHISARKTSC